MLSVSIVDSWLARQRAAQPGQRAQRGGVIIRSGGCGFPGCLEGQPGEQAGVQRAGDDDCGRSGRDQRPGVSGPSSGARTLRLQLVMIPAGTRGEPHCHAAAETAVYLVSGEAEVWHGAGLGRRSVVRAGDFIYVPAGTPHVAVNRGAVTAIAVAASADPAIRAAAAVPVELPGHLAALGAVPVSGDLGAGAPAAAPHEPSPPSRSPRAGTRRTRHGHGSILLCRRPPGASLPPQAGLAVSRPGSPLV